MENAPVAIEQNTVAIVPDSVITEYLESLGNKLSIHHRNQFIQIARAFNLNPFLRQVYGIPYGDKFNIIVGYEVYLQRAERSGLLSGWKAWTEGDGKTMKGCVEIRRRDWDAPFYHEALFSEYDQNNQMWKSKPATMIKKVAIAQGFRMAFPVELGGMPYTADEIPTGPEPPLLTGKPEVSPPQPRKQTVIDATPEPTPAPKNGNGNGTRQTATEEQIDKLTVLLAEYCDGNTVEMEGLLKTVSGFKDRNGNEKFLTLADLNTEASGKWVGGSIGNLEKYIEKHPKAIYGGDEPEAELF